MNFGLRWVYLSVIRVTLTLAGLHTFYKDKIPIEIRPSHRVRFGGIFRIEVELVLAADTSVADLGTLKGGFLWHKFPL